MQGSSAGGLAAGEERVYDGWSSGSPGTVDRTFQFLWGGRYIDDIVWHREDVNNDGDFVDAGDRRWWHLTDAQFSTVAIVDDAAVLAEQARWRGRLARERSEDGRRVACPTHAYGRAAHFHAFDNDGDRDFDAADRTALSNLIASGSVPITSGSYDAAMDLDRDGDVDSTDLSIMGTGYTAALGLGALSSGTVGNTIGWDGYVFSGEVPGASGGGMYHVRFRWYEVGLGRWVQRDPAGYVDGMGLYEYVSSTPMCATDPSGRYSGLRFFLNRPKSSHAHGCCERRPFIAFDFDGFPLDSWNPINWLDYAVHYPSPIYFPTSVTQVRSYLDAIAKNWKIGAEPKCICFETIVIAAHGSGPGSISFGGGALGTIHVKTILDIGIDETRKSYAQDLDRFLEVISMLDMFQSLGDYLCPGGTIELLVCDAGSDAGPAPYGTRLRQVLETLLPGRRIVLSNGTCKFSFRGTWHDDSGTNESPANPASRSEGGKCCSWW